MTELIRPTTRQIRHVLGSLESRQFSRMCNLVFKVDWMTTIEPAVQLKMYVFEWLDHLNFLGEARIRWLLEKWDRDLRPVAENIEKAWPRFSANSFDALSIMDRRYARLTDGPLWDMETEALADQNTVLVTYISVDLAALFYSKQKWLRQLRGEHGREPELTGTESQSPT